LQPFAQSRDLLPNWLQRRSTEKSVACLETVLFPGTGGHSSSDDVDGGGVPNSGGSANGGGPSDVELSESMFQGSVLSGSW